MLPSIRELTNAKCTTTIRRIALLLGIMAGIMVDGCGFVGPVLDASSQCRVADRHRWVSSGLGVSQVVEPVCPVIIPFNNFPAAYAFHLTITDPSLLSFSRFGFVSFFNNLEVQVNPPAGAYLFGFENGGSEVLVTGIYDAGTDTSSVGINSGTDFGRIRVHLADGDSARGEAFLTYRRRTPAVLTGPTFGTTADMLTFTTDASAEYRPVQYEWYVNGEPQGPISQEASFFSSAFEVPGPYTVEVLVVPGHTEAPYTISLGVEINEFGGCGGPDQPLCTTPPVGNIKKQGALAQPRPPKLP